MFDLFGIKKLRKEAEEEFEKAEAMLISAEKYHTETRDTLNEAKDNLEQTTSIRKKCNEIMDVLIENHDKLIHMKPEYMVYTDEGIRGSSIAFYAAKPIIPTVTEKDVEYNNYINCGKGLSLEEKRNLIGQYIEELKEKTIVRINYP